MDAAALLEAVRDQRDDLLDFLTRLAQIETPSSVPAAQGPAFELIEEALAGLDYEGRRVSGVATGGYLLAAPRGAGVELERFSRRDAGIEVRSVQLLLGHCDTVWPLGTLREMPVRLEEGKLFGPGIFDMKAGLAQTIFALRSLQRLGLRPDPPPLLLVNSDEEIGSPESRPLIEGAARRAARVFVMEPALGPEGRLKTARKGVGQFVLEVVGKAAHAGLDPEAGASAIVELSHQVHRLHALNDPDLGVSVNVGTIAGGTRPNVVAPEAEAVIDVRVPDREQAERVGAAIRALQPVTPGVRLAVRGGIERLPLERTPRNRALWRLAQRLAGQMGLAIDEGCAGGGSDGNLTSPLAATLDGLGAVGAGAHAVHEHIDVERSLERCALLGALLIAAPVVVDDH